MNGDLGAVWKKVNEIHAHGCARREQEEDRTKSLEGRINAVENKIWAIILLLIANLAASLARMIPG